MKIKRILNQYRRDFYADYECESCGHIDHNTKKGCSKNEEN